MAPKGDTKAVFRLVSAGSADEAKEKASDEETHDYIESKPVDANNSDYYKFEKVEEGTYWIVETQAPKYYNLGEPVEVKVTYDEYGLMHVEFLGDVTATIAMPDNEFNEEESYVIDGLNHENGKLSDGTKFAAYCLQATKQIPATTNYSSASSYEYSSDIDFIKATLGLGDDENAVEKAELIREKVITYLYFGYGGEGHKDDTDKSFLKIDEDFYTLYSTYKDQTKPRNLVLYYATQAAIWEVTDDGTYKPDAITPYYQNNLYTQFKKLLESKTYKDVINDVRSRNSNVSNISIGLNLLVPQKEELGYESTNMNAIQKQVMVSQKNVTITPYAFDYMDEQIQVELPNTGGAGTLLFYIIGGAAIAGGITAIVIGSRRKKKFTDGAA